MKIRNGFVSNSSSSSFVLSTKKDIDHITMTIDVPFDETISNLDELSSYFEDIYGISIKELLLDGEIEYEEYMKLSQVLSEGNKIVIINASNEDGEGIGKYLYYNGFHNVILDKDIKILKEE